MKDHNCYNHESVVLQVVWQNVRCSHPREICGMKCVETLNYAIVKLEFHNGEKTMDCLHPPPHLTGHYWEELPD